MSHDLKSPLASIQGFLGRVEKQAAAGDVGRIEEALAKRIVEQHGGRIWVESEGRGHGAAFCFTLRRRAEHELPG